MPRGTGRVDEAILQSRLWSPSVLRPSLWMDAADLSTLTMDSNNVVDEWRDKSGFNRHATRQGGTITYQPGGWAGLPCLSFAPLTRMEIASAPIFASGNSNIGLFAVLRPNFVSASYSAVFNNYLAGNFELMTGGIAPYITPYGLYNNESIDLSNEAYVRYLRQMIGTTRTDGYFTGFRNGNEQNTVANNQSVYIGAATQSVWTINSNTIGSESDAQDYCELIAINANVPYATRTKVEGYLAWRWDLVESLNPNHPYANRPPLIGE